MSENLDLDILQIFKTKDYFDRYYALVDYNILCTEAKTILNAYEQYYDKFDDNINYTKFSPWFFNTLHRDFMPDDVKYYKSIFTNISKLKSSDIESTLTRMKQKQLWNQLKQIRNDDFDLTSMKDIIAEYETGIKDTSKSIKYLSLDEVFNDEEMLGGMSWRLGELQNGWGNIKNQRLYVVMATTHTGKSSFVISESLYFLRQLRGTGKNVLYFNNESSERQIFERYMCGLFNKTSDEIRNNAAKVREIYEKRYPGEPLRIFSARNGTRSMKEIEAACSIYNPGVVVIDQLDKLISEKDRSSRRPYEKVYSWARDLAVKYNTPVLGVTQYGVSTDRHGNVVNNKMHQHGSFDAKIDKAANTDFLIGVQNIDDSNTTKRIYLIRAKEGKEGISFVCKFNRDTGVYSNF